MTRGINYDTFTAANVSESMAAKPLLLDRAMHIAYRHLDADYRTTMADLLHDKIRPSFRYARRSTISSHDAIFLTRWRIYRSLPQEKNPATDTDGSNAAGTHFSYAHLVRTRILLECPLPSEVLGIINTIDQPTPPVLYA